MSKLLANEQKEPAAAAKIENIQWSQPMELQVLHALDIHFHPPIEPQKILSVFFRICFRCFVAGLNLTHARLIDLR